MTSDVVFLMPICFDNDSSGPGHKKDLFNILNFFKDKGNTVSINYFDKKNRVFNNGKYIMGLKSFFYEHEHTDRLVVGPLYACRHLIKSIPTSAYIYVADSPLKTSITAAAKRLFYFHRVIYNYYIERALLKFNIIVASQEEFSWFSSCGHSLNKIHLLLPSPDINRNDKSKIIHNEGGVKHVFLFNPNGCGVDFAKRLLTNLSDKLSDRNSILNISISGREALSITKSSEYTNLNITNTGYIEDIDEHIKKSDIVVLTDVGGSGLCNRSVQVRANSTLLVATLDSVRGSCMYYDDGVVISNEPFDMADKLITYIDSTSEDNFTDKYFHMHINKYMAQLENIYVSMY